MTGKSLTYILGPIKVRSSIPLPFTPVAADMIDVELEVVDHIPEVPSNATSAPPLAWLDSCLWINDRGSTRAYVKDGARISVVVSPALASAELRGDLLDVPHLRSVLMLALSALLVQRGMLLLHASATTLDGVARIYLGRSGSGKSTAALFDSLRGAAVLADDLVPVFIDQDGLARTFQCDPLCAIVSEPEPAVAWVHQAVADSVGVRMDGKTLFKPTPIDSSKTFPLQEVVCLDARQGARHTGSSPRMCVLLNLVEQVAGTSLHQTYLGKQHLQLASTIAKQVQHIAWRPQGLHTPLLGALHPEGKGAQQIR